MCTALSLTTNDHYFGRTLDLECRFDESVVVMPRGFPLAMRRLPESRDHFAMIGMATVRDGFPLYYDAVNEAGLAMAALNFPGYAAYLPAKEDAVCVASFELIPWILSRCASIAEARMHLEHVRLCDDRFSDELQTSPLHFMLSDKSGSLVAEPLPDGLHLHDNPAGVMTNSPPFDYHMTRLCDFMALSPAAPQNCFAPSVPLSPYSRGMGALSLPGDWSSSSRFIRAAFLAANSVCPDDEASSVQQFFHILGAVSHVRGSVLVHDRPEITQYTSCMNTARGVYYYTTYDNSRITAIDLHAAPMDGNRLFSYPLHESSQILRQNPNDYSIF